MPGDRALHLSVSANAWRFLRHFVVTIFKFLCCIPVNSAKDNVGANTTTPEIYKENIRKN